MPRRPCMLMILLAVAVVLPAATDAADAPGAVYVLTNSPAGNAVLVYDCGGDGSLSAGQAYPTGPAPARVSVHRAR